MQQLENLFEERALMDLRFDEFSELKSKFIQPISATRFHVICGYLDLKIRHHLCPSVCRTSVGMCESTNDATISPPTNVARQVESEVESQQGKKKLHEKNGSPRHEALARWRKSICRALWPSWKIEKSRQRWPKSEPSPLTAPSKIAIGRINNDRMRQPDNICIHPLYYCRTHTRTARNHRTCTGHPHKEIPGCRATVVSSKSVIIAVRDTREVICENTCDHHSRLWYLDIAELITLGRRQTRPANPAQTMYTRWPQQCRIKQRHSSGRKQKQEG